MCARANQIFDWAELEESGYDQYEAWVVAQALKYASMCGIILSEDRKQFIKDNLPETYLPDEKEKDPNPANFDSEKVVEITDPRLEKRRHSTVSSLGTIDYVSGVPDVNFPIAQEKDALMRDHEKLLAEHRKFFLVRALTSVGKEMASLLALLWYAAVGQPKGVYQPKEVVDRGDPPQGSKAFS